MSDQQATVDSNSAMFRAGMACLLMRAPNHRIRLTPEELGNLLTVDADVNFVLTDDGAIELGISYFAHPALNRACFSPRGFRGQRLSLSVPLINMGRLASALAWRAGQ